MHGCGNIVVSLLQGCMQSFIFVGSDNSSLRYSQKKSFEKKKKQQLNIDLHQQLLFTL